MEVGPSSFQKIKLLGRGDVGKVYLVREKKTDKLFAMKGTPLLVLRERDANVRHMNTYLRDSAIKKGDDCTKKDQTCIGGTRNPSDCQSPLYCDAVPLVPI